MSPQETPPSASRPDPQLFSAADRLHRSVGFGTFTLDGRAHNPVAHVSGLPVQSMDVWVKQINSERVSDLGRAALAIAFSGFLDAAEHQPRREEYVREIEQLFGRYDFDPSVQRRFSGDKTLARGRYFSVCDENGFDHGTLQGELRAYHNPDHGGIVQTFDLTIVADRDFSRLHPAIPKDTDPRQLVVTVHPLGDQPNPFVERSDDFGCVMQCAKILGPTSVLIALPLTVKKIHRKRVINLRDPTVALWFARTMSRLAWDIGGGKLEPCFPQRPPLDRFDEILPEILVQERGGGGLTTATGLLLRYAGADALIFPSARSDALVTVLDGKVVANSGWNLVDYSGAAPPNLLSWHELGTRWPSMIGFRPYPDASEGEEPLWYPEVQVAFNESGPHAGSWRISGLRRRCDIMWRRRQLDYALFACHDRLSVDAFGRLAAFLDVLDHSGEIELIGRFSTCLYAAVLGDVEAARELAAHALLMRKVEQLKPVAETLDELLTRVHEPHAKALADLRSIYIPCQDRV
jgi:hypothetical protein